MNEARGLLAGVANTTDQTLELVAQSLCGAGIVSVLPPRQQTADTVHVQETQSTITLDIDDTNLAASNFKVPTERGAVVWLPTAGCDSIHAGLFIPAGTVINDQLFYVGPYVMDCKPNPQTFTQAQAFPYVGTGIFTNIIESLTVVEELYAPLRDSAVGGQYQIQLDPLLSKSYDSGRAVRGICMFSCTSQQNNFQKSEYGGFIHGASLASTRDVAQYQGRGFPLARLKSTCVLSKEYLESTNLVETGMVMLQGPMIAHELSDVTQTNYSEKKQRIGFFPTAANAAVGSGNVQVPPNNFETITSIYSCFASPVGVTAQFGVGINGENFAIDKIGELSTMSYRLQQDLDIHANAPGQYIAAGQVEVWFYDYFVCTDMNHEIYLAAFRDSQVIASTYTNIDMAASNGKCSINRVHNVADVMDDHYKKYIGTAIHVVWRSQSNLGVQFPEWTVAAGTLSAIATDIQQNGLNGPANVGIWSRVVSGQALQIDVVIANEVVAKPDLNVFIRGKPTKHLTNPAVYQLLSLLYRDIPQLRRIMTIQEHNVLLALWEQRGREIIARAVQQNPELAAAATAANADGFFSMLSDSLGGLARSAGNMIKSNLPSIIDTAKTLAPLALKYGPMLVEGDFGADGDFGVRASGDFGVPGASATSSMTGFRQGSKLDQACRQIGANACGSMVAVRRARM